MKNPWPWMVLFGLFVFGLAAIFSLSDDPTQQASVLGYFDTLVSFVVGGGAGAAAGAGLTLLRNARPAGAPMPLTWPLVAAVACVIGAMVLMFASTDDPGLQSAIVDYAKAILPFVIGAGVGTAAGRSMV